MAGCGCPGAAVGVEQHTGRYLKPINNRKPVSKLDGDGTVSKLENMKGGTVDKTLASPVDSADISDAAAAAAAAAARFFSSSL